MTNKNIKTSLPLFAATFVKSANEFGFITTGETGYTRAPSDYTAEKQAEFNKENGVGEAELLTMELCSLVGWSNAADIYSTMQAKMS